MNTKIKKINKAWRLSTKMQTRIQSYYILKNDHSLSDEDRLFYGRMYIIYNIRYCDLIDYIDQLDQDTLVKYQALNQLQA